VSATRVLFLGGNGHCAFRLAAARKAAVRLGLTIDEVPYPGFEGRPCPADLDSFLTETAHVLALAPIVYATGIGGLLALCLRARGALRGRRLILQAPVLWGLEHRLMPRLMRLSPMRVAATRLLSFSPLQAAFVRRTFERPLGPDERRAFFEGYRRCRATARLFEWLTPAQLRGLERDFAADRTALDDIEVWWGGRDRVVTTEELRRTERALGVSWPLTTFPDWGHYPMIDAPDAWASALTASA
jgi:pimeloyl-ACP methyl ester carboxylesterase